MLIKLILEACKAKIDWLQARLVVNEILFEERQQLLAMITVLFNSET